MADLKVAIAITGKDDASGPIGRVVSALKQLGGQATNSQGPLGKITSSLKGMITVAGGNLIADGVGRGIDALKSLGSEALNATAQHEQLSLALENLAARELRARDSTLGMAESLELAAPLAQELLGWTQQLALESPFSQQDISQTYKMAAAYGFTLDESKRLTTATLDMAAGMGLSGDQMEGVIMALGQIRAKGKVSAEELNQLRERGFDANAVLERMGYTLDDVSRGLVDANQFISEAASVMEEDFGGAAKRTTDTLSGLLSTIGDIKDVGLRNLFGGTFEALKPLLSEITGFLSDQSTMDRLKEIGDAFGTRLAHSIQLGRDAIITFRQAADGAWIDRDLIHPFHQAAGVVGTFFGAFEYGRRQWGDFEGALYGIERALDQLFDRETMQRVYEFTDNVGTLRYALGDLLKELEADPNISLVGGLQGLATLLLPGGPLIKGIGLFGIAYRENWFGIRDVTDETLGLIRQRIEGFGLPEIKFDDLLDGIRNFDASDVDGLLDSIRQRIEAFDLSDAIGNALAGLSGFAREINLGEMVVTGSVDAVGFATDIVRGIRDALPGVRIEGAQVVASIREWLEQEGPGFKDWVANEWWPSVWPELKAFDIQVGMLLDDIYDMFAEAGASARRALLDVLNVPYSDAEKPNMQQLLGLDGDGSGEGGYDWSAWASNVLNGLNDALVAQLNHYGAIVAEHVKGWIVEQITQAMNDASLDITGKSIWQWDRILTEGMENAKAILDGDFSSIGEMFDSLKVRVATGASNILNDLTVTLPNGATELLTSWKGNIPSTGEVFDTFEAGLSEAAGTIYEKLTSYLPEGATALLGSWGESIPAIETIMTSAGTNMARIIDDVRDAIDKVPTSTAELRDMWGGAWESVKGVADRVISPIKGIVDGIRGAVDGLISALRNLSNLDISMPSLPSLPGIPGLATGGIAERGGMYLVGEQGPELFLPRSGGTIIPAPRTQRLLAADTGGGSVQVVQNFYGPVDKSQVFTASRDGVKSALRARGMR